MKLTLEYVEKDYNNLKKIIKKELDRKNYEDCLNLISCAANIAYHLNFRFYDDELENYLKTISFDLIKDVDFESISGRWVFYDYFGLDNRGLTQQYLNVLDDMGVEYLYILEKYTTETNHKDIIEQVKKNDKAEIYINDSSLDFKMQIENIIKVIREYKPEKSLLHFSPWSSLSIILWSKLNFVERYFINLTDHAFWLGKNSFDYCLEFREYGAYFSNKFRKIEKDKLLLSPFYPIIIEKEFLGFPEKIEDKIKIFSGGSYYKIYGANNLFFEIVKNILNKYESTVLLFAGSGNDKPFKEFIEKNNFNKRIILLGHRSDINEVIKNCDIYLNTYPVGAGLLPLFPLLNSIPIISYGEKELEVMFIETVLYKKGIDCTYINLDDFYKNFEYLIKNYQSVSYDKNLICPTRRDFLNNFKKIISEDIENKDIKDFEFSKKRFFDLYLDTENNYLKEYDLIKFRWLGLKYFKYDFFGAFISTIKILINHRKLIIRKIVKKLKLVR